MDIDVAAMIGAVDRTVENRDRDGRPARAVVATRAYDTSVDDLWDALTSPARIPRWFLPISGELRLGGHYQLEGNAGGKITHCTPPRHLGVTWEYGGDVGWLDLTLTEEAGGGARLLLEHVGHVPDEFWDQYGPGAVGVGWDLALFGLGRYIATGEAIDPKDAEAWSLSDEGKNFSGRSSDAWCRASIAAGTDEGAATAAAVRTTAFYTGETIETGEDDGGGESGGGGDIGGEGEGEADADAGA